jgi:hypothetical protein
LLDRTLPDQTPAFFKSLAAYARARINPDTDKAFTRAAGSKWKKDGLVVWVDAETGEPVADPDGYGGALLIDAAASDSARNAAQNPLKRQAPAPGAFIAASPPAHPSGGGEAAAAPIPSRPVAAVGEDAEAADVIEPAPEPRQPRDPMQDTVSRAKAHGAVLDAKIKEIAYKERIGDLVPTAEIRFREAARMGALRDALLQLPGLVAEEANPDNPGRARKAIADGVNRVLEQYIAEQRAALSAEVETARAAAEERTGASEAAHA